MPHRLLELFRPKHAQKLPQVPKKLDLMATLWPSMPHFAEFALDPRLSGIRLNQPMVSLSDLAQELTLLRNTPTTVPLWYDIKSRQLRVAEVHDNPTCLEVTLNHPISLDVNPSTTKVPVLLKSGSDFAYLRSISDDGRRLLFKPGAQYGPQFEVVPGDSLCIRNAGLSIQGPLFIDQELEKIEMLKVAGFTRFFLSYVESEKDVTEFLDLVGYDAEVMLKIESLKGLDYVAHGFKPRPNVRLMAARGDLYVEIDKAHQIMDALRLIVEKDPTACLGSRIFLSLGLHPEPECADFLELAWLYDIGYSTMMLCDHVCLNDETLSIAVAAFDSFREDYAKIS